VEKMEIKEYIDKIKNLNACSEAVENALKYKTSQELWDNCERGDWMLWLIGGLSGKPESEKRKQLVLTACKCARLALKYVPEGETRPLKAIETAEKWANGEATIEEVRAAAYAAYNAAAYAAYAAYAAAAAYAADAAAYAAYAAAANAYAVDVAYAAAGTANAATANARTSLKQCADIVRKDYPSIDALFE
jgi:hypothetical protein